MSRKKSRQKHKNEKPRPRIAETESGLKADVIPTDWLPSSKAMWWMRLGTAARFLRLRRLTRLAALRFEPLVQGQPFALMWVAEVLAEAGDEEGAVRVVCEAEGWPQGDARGYEVLGWALRDTGRVREAREYLRKAVTRGSTDLDVWYVYISESIQELHRLKARWLPASERSRRARELLHLAKETAKRAPDRADSHILVGSCFVLLDRNLEARQAFEKAAAIEPDTADLERLLALSTRRLAPL